jgi:hypothetical protein
MFESCARLHANCKAESENESEKKHFLDLHSDKHAIGQLSDVASNAAQCGRVKIDFEDCHKPSTCHVSLLPVAAAFSLFYGFLTFMCMQLSFDFYILNETEAVAAQRTRKRLGDLFM